MSLVVSCSALALPVFGGVEIVAVQDTGAVTIPSSGRIAILCMSGDLSHRKPVEDGFAARFRGQVDAVTVPSYTILDPTREYTGDETFALLNAAGVTTLVTVTLDGPPANLTEEAIALGWHESAGQKRRGLAQHLSLELWDVASGTRGWTAIATDSAPVGATLEVVVGPIAERIAEELVKDGFTTKPASQGT